MKPRPVTDQDLEVNGGRKQVFKCPPTMPDCTDAEVIMQENRIIMPWVLTDDDLERLQSGGSVWLSIWGSGMPPVGISVD